MTSLKPVMLWSVIAISTDWDEFSSNMHDNYVRQFCFVTDKWTLAWRCDFADDDIMHDWPFTQRWEIITSFAKKQPCFTLCRTISVLSDTMLPAPFFEVYFEKLFLKMHQIVELNFHIKFHLILFLVFWTCFYLFSLELKHSFYFQEGYGSLNGLKEQDHLIWFL